MPKKTLLNTILDSWSDILKNEHIQTSINQILKFEQQHPEVLDKDEWFNHIIDSLEIPKKIKNNLSKMLVANKNPHIGLPTNSLISEEDNIVRLVGGLKNIVSVESIIVKNSVDDINYWQFNDKLDFETPGLKVTIKEAILSNNDWTIYSFGEKNAILTSMNMNYIKEADSQQYQVTYDQNAEQEVVQEVVFLLQIKDWKQNRSQKEITRDLDVLKEWQSELKNKINQMSIPTLFKLTTTSLTRTIDDKISADNLRDEAEDNKQYHKYLIHSLVGKISALVLEWDKFKNNLDNKKLIQGQEWIVQKKLMLELREIRKQSFSKWETKDTAVQQEIESELSSSIDDINNYKSPNATQSHTKNNLC